MKITYCLVVLPILLVQGCATINDSKTMLITPEQGQSEVVVESVTTARCKDIIGVITCNVAIDLHQAKRENVQVNTPDKSISQPALAAAPPKAAVQPTVANQDSTHKSTATARLKDLDELNKSGLISKDEYKQKRQEILKEL